MTRSRLLPVARPARALAAGGASAPRPRRFAPFPNVAVVAVVAAFAAFATVGCGDDERRTSGREDAQGAPALGRAGDEDRAGSGSGSVRSGSGGSPLAPAPPVAATKNTTRVLSADPVATAAAVALTVFPARTPENRPRAVVLADVRDPRVGITAAQLMSAPLRAPVLYASGRQLPEATRRALAALAPTGAARAGGAQVIRVGDVPAPPGLRSMQLRGVGAAALARAVDALQSRAAERRSDAVVVAPSDRPDLAMPAAGWAAKSGDPVLWAGRDVLPRETLAAARAHRRPRIYVLGPPEAISDRVLRRLDRVGPAKRIGTGDPVTSAIFLARYSDGAFGWNVVDPGHGLVFANLRRTADAGAAAPLSASGSWGPLMLLADARALPQPVQEYLLDIQPGYSRDPVRGVYNHGWLMGDESAISADVQSRIDALLEIQPVQTGGE